MQLKDIIDSPCGMGYMIEQLDLQSGYARRWLLERPIMTCEDDILLSYDILHRYVDFINRIDAVHLNTLIHKLMCIKDLHTTIANLKNRSVLDDIELFEVKHLSLLASDVKKLLEQHDMGDVVEIPSTDEIVSILDPDGMRIATFYVYDSYDERLKSLRARMRKHPEEQEAILIETTEIEDKVRTRLSKELFPFADALEQAQSALACIDVTIAKAKQFQEMGMCFPVVSHNNESSYRELFNPQVKNVLSQAGTAFQLVNISFGNKPTLITGANMGGKTVVLKTVTLCQYLFQFGFGIPAGQASIALKDEVYFCIGDEQSVEKGLSSFAAEMKNIDTVIKASRSDRKILALIDEPARTTNPLEGTALVTALLSVLNRENVSVLMTTHYDVDAGDAHCLRVRGFENGEMNYALVEVHNGEVPHEALNIAENLGIDAQWIDKAREILDL